MFLGHLAIGLAARRVEPRVSLATWFVAVQLVDLIWPVMLLLDLEHVAIAPGITAFTPLDFFDYPITHSLVGSLVWAALFAAFWFSIRANPWRKFPGAVRVGAAARRGRAESLGPRRHLTPAGCASVAWWSLSWSGVVELDPGHARRRAHDVRCRAGDLHSLRLPRGGAGLVLAVDRVSAHRLLCRRVRSTSAECHDGGVVGACAVATHPVGALG
jgi:hypothetical protein